MTGLPDSLKRAGAQRLADREGALLDNLATVRDVEAGIPPDLKEDLIAWLGSCFGMGLEMKEKIGDERRTIYVAKFGAVTVAHLWVVHEDGGVRIKMYPTDNPRRVRR